MSKTTCPEKLNGVCAFADCPCNFLKQHGLTYIPIDMPESDRQYLESLTVSSEEIAKVFGYNVKPKYSTLQEEMIKGRFRTK